MEPSGPRQERRLAAIMFADMVGYTALMQENEEQAHHDRDRHRAVLEAAVARHQGEILQYYGDGSLSTFSSAVEAVQCAVDIQRALREPPAVPLRIGVHTGDIVFDGDGVYGDGVNVASRIEALAAPGGVLVSDRVYDDVKNHPEIPTVPMGSVRLKNVKRPVEVFAVSAEGVAVPAPEDVQAKAYSGTPGSGPVEEAGVALPWTASPGGVGPSPWTRPGAVLLGLALVLAGVWGLSVLSGAPDDSPPAGPGAEQALRSIAVLPFVNASAAQEDAAFFADGLHDDLLTQLTKIGDLDVIARTSVMRYAGTTLPVPDIAAELGVETVVEGRVQRAGDRLRINVQLIDARDGTHLWAEIYDRELTAENVFAIQTEIAREIAAALRSELDSDEAVRLGEIPTENLEAYEAFLRGEAYYQRPGWEESDLLSAQGLFERAVELDPGFARAHSALSLLHNDMYLWAHDRSAERIERARQAAEQALAAEPGFALGHFALGRYFLSTLQLDQALRELAIAERGMPGSTLVPTARGQVLVRQGRFEDAIENQRRTASLDPGNPIPLFELAFSYILLRRYDEGEQRLNRVLALEATFFEAALNKAMIPIWRDRNTSAMRAFLAGMPLGADPMGLSDVFLRWWVETIDGDFGSALDVLSEAEEGTIDFASFFYPKQLLLGWTYQGMGDANRAERAFEAAAAVLEAEVETRDADPRIHSALGLTYANLGRSEEAVREGQRAVELLPVSEDALEGPYFLHELARIYARIGDGPGAARALEAFLDGPTPWSAGLVLPDPIWDPVREDPRFRALEERFAAAGPA